MYYTNELNLPQNLADILASSDYNIGKPYTISGTELLKPARIYILEKMYKRNLQGDVSNNIASFVGTAIHKRFEEYY